MFKLKTNASTVSRHLLKRSQNIESKLQTVLKKLSEAGLKVARVSLGDLVFVEEITKGVSICTNSQEAIFIEFGAGFGATHPMAFELSYTPGSWSATHARQFVTKGYWYFNGKKYTTIPAQMGLYEAGKHIKEIAVEVVKEVYGNGRH